MQSIYAHFSDIIHFQLYTVILMAALFYKVYWIHAIYDQFYTLNGILHFVSRNHGPIAHCNYHGNFKMTLKFYNMYPKRSCEVVRNLVQLQCRQYILNSWVHHPPCIFYKQFHYGTLVGCPHFHCGKLRIWHSLSFFSFK